MVVACFHTKNKPVWQHSGLHANLLFRIQNNSSRFPRTIFFLDPLPLLLYSDFLCRVCYIKRDDLDSLIVWFISRMRSKTVCSPSKYMTSFWRSYNVETTSCACCSRYNLKQPNKLGHFVVWFHILNKSVLVELTSVSRLLSASKSIGFGAGLPRFSFSLSASISRSISCSKRTISGGRTPKMNALRATSNNVKMTDFSFLCSTRSSLSNKQTSGIPNSRHHWMKLATLSREMNEPLNAPFIVIDKTKKYYSSSLNKS